MHPLLAEQLARAFGELPPNPTPQLAALLEAVEGAYQRADAEQLELRRHLDESGLQLRARNQQLEQDLTQLTRFEQALADSRAELQEILSAIPDQVWLVESDGELVDPRPRLPSVDADELLDALVVAGNVHHVCARARELGQAVHWEYSGTVQGRRLLFEARAIPHGTDRSIVLVRDMTELRLTQAQLSLSERMASVGVMASGVAHEVNNPLTYVVANLGHVARELERLSPVLQQQGETDLLAATLEAQRGAERVSEIVRDLRWFAGPHANKPARCDLNEVVDSALSLTANETRHRAQLVRNRMELPPIEADASRLGQVLINLLVNAAQSIEAGHVEENRIEVSTSLADEQIVLQITDTGVGIAPEHLSRVFDPFFSTKQHAGGTGLGLSIARKIVEEHGGTIQFDSQLGVGTQVTVRLPTRRTARTDRPAPGESVRAPTLRPESSEAAEILIVDDEAEVGRAMRRALSMHNITLVRTGAEALELFSRRSYDLVICDLMMPQMTGMELLAQAQSAFPEHAARFVFMTGGAFSEAGQRFLMDLRSEYLEKPFDQNSLREFVVRQLARLTAQAEAAPSAAP